jgi:hypothetical protein
MPEPRVNPGTRSNADCPRALRALASHKVRASASRGGGRLTDDMRGEIFHLFRFLRFEPDRDHVAGGFLSLYVKAL